MTQEIQAELSDLAPMSAEGEDHAAIPDIPRLSARQRIARGGNVLLTGVFVGGLVVVYVLSLRVGPAKASAEQLMLESTVDGALSQLAAAVPANATTASQDVADVFYYEAQHRQIPARHLPTNPFIFVTPRPAVQEVVNDSAPPEQEDPQVQELSEAMKLVAGLALQSVLQNERGGTAMISNNLLAQGQTIRGWTVTEIRPREVVLSWRQHTYVLRMSE